MMFWDLICQEGGKYVRQVYLLGAVKVFVAEHEVLAHDAEGDFFVAENVADLAQHLLNAYVRSHIACAVVAGEKQFQLLSRLPGLPCPEHPAEFRAFDAARNPGFEDQVHHAADPPACVGQLR